MAARRRSRHVSRTWRCGLLSFCGVDASAVQVVRNPHELLLLCTRAHPRISDDGLPCREAEACEAASQHGGVEIWSGHDGELPRRRDRGDLCDCARSAARHCRTRRGAQSARNVGQQARPLRPPAGWKLSGAPAEGQARKRAPRGGCTGTCPRTRNVVGTWLEIPPPATTSTRIPASGRAPAPPSAAAPALAPIAPPAALPAAASGAGLPFLQKIARTSSLPSGALRFPSPDMARCSPCR